MYISDLQLHNADQLADWCMNHLCVNYNKLCKMSARSVRLLHPENQEYLNEHRWPPVWYEHHQNMSPIFFFIYFL